MFPDIGTEAMICCCCMVLRWLVDVYDLMQVGIVTLLWNTQSKILYFMYHNNYYNTSEPFVSILVAFVFCYNYLPT